jgi:hypothetical protein
MRTRSHDVWAVAACVAASLAVAYLGVYHPLALAVAIAATAIAAVLLFAPLQWLAMAIIFGLLTSPEYEVQELLPSDLAVAAAATAALVRGRTAVLRRGRYERWLLFVAWAVIVTSTGPGLVPLVHTFAPVAGGYLVASLCGSDHMWRAVRWWAIASILTAPLLTGDLSARWTGLPGGPNELGLLAAMLVVLAYSAPVGTRWRVAQVALGFAGLAVTQSISAGVAALLGVFLLRPYRPMRIPSPSALKVALAAGVVAVVATRPDLVETLTVHGDQAAATAGVLESTDWLTGGGWLHGAEQLVGGSIDTDYSSVLFDSVHNVYLQLLTDTGLIGLGLFLAALLATWRQSDRRGRAALATVAVWLNTTGAYPNAAWGLLGLVVAATAWQPVRVVARRRHPSVPLHHAHAQRS